MKNTVAMAVAVLVVPLTLAGCTGVGTTSTGPASAPASDQKVTLTVWSAFSDRELKGLGDAMDRLPHAAPEHHDQERR